MNMNIQRDKIHILHLISRYHLRGAERFASQLSGSLASRGFRNSICSLYKSDSNGFSVDKSVDSLSIAARKIGYAAGIGLQPLVLLKMVGVFRKIKPDIVFAHGADTMKYAALARTFCPEVSIVYKNIGMASYWARGRFRVWANTRLLKNIDAVVSVSRASREDFLKLYGLPQNKVRVINNAIDSRKYRGFEIGQARLRIREEFGMSEKDSVLIAIGNLSPEKNHEEIITLLSELGKKSPHLILVGSGTCREKLERLAKDVKIHDRVHFTGLQNDVVPFLAAADIFVLPSKSEGMPGVLIEAGMAGLPSVAYDVGGVKEVIDSGVTGIIVPPHDYPKFKAAVMSLLAEPLLQKQMGSQARQKCLTHFDIENITDEYETMILDVLENREKI